MINRRNLFVSLVLAGLMLIMVGLGMAQEDHTSKPPLHPVFPLLDETGENVLSSGAPVSPVQTCGACHDADFILSHNDHLSAFSSTPDENSDWNPITYTYETTRTSEDVTGVNCFLCHTTNPNNATRLQHTDEWSSSATLIGSGIIDENLNWQEQAFDPNGNLRAEFISIQDPKAENCGQCHGTVHSNAQLPLEMKTCDPSQTVTYQTGQVFSPQKLSQTGLNLADKEELSRSWDIHAERVVECVDCHHSPNNPSYDTQTRNEDLEHLTFDPRRLDLGDYLYRPVHEFKNTDSLACENCHEADHEWLPYQERHTSVLACETCHIPRLYAPALQTVDWTVIQPDGSPLQTCRGVASDDNRLLTGYEPVILPTEMNDGSTRLAPYNLSTAWYWVAGADETPIPLEALQNVWLENGVYPAEILAIFDQNTDGELNADELQLDSEAKQNLIAERLSQAGFENPQIMGEVQASALHHNVINGEWATRDCQSCHTDDSKLTETLLLSSYTPNGGTPHLQTLIDGEVTVTDSGEVVFEPQTQNEAVSLYIFGHSRVSWVDWLGATLLIATLLGIGGHSTLRYLSAKQREPHTPELKKVYMYSLYERQWHWLQTTVILGLMFTGLIIHKPDMFGLFSFPYMVQIHNILAAILVINAALSAFYHLASGEIRQYLPQPRSFLLQGIQQARFYIVGMFKGEEHPFEKSAEHKLNPLQQMTYLAILNILLPLQVITGALMWGAQRYPELTDRLGGLTFLAPFHTLIAWLFVSFVVGHVYLTTTGGHTPLAGIRAMMMGWDDIEVHQKLAEKEV